MNPLNVDHQHAQQELGLLLLNPPLQPNEGQQMMQIMQHIMQKQEEEAARLRNQIESLLRNQVEQRSMIEALGQHQEGNFESIEGTLETITRQQDATHSVLTRFRTECMSQLNEIGNRMGRMRRDCHFTTLDGWIECIKQLLMLLLSLAKMLCKMMYELHVLIVSFIRTTGVVPWIGSVLVFVLEMSFYMVEIFFAITLVDFIGFITGINPDLGGSAFDLILYVFFQGVYYMTWIIHQFGSNISRVPTQIARAFRSSQLSGILTNALNDARALLGQQYKQAVDGVIHEVVQGVNDQLPKASDLVPDVTQYIPDVSEYVPTWEGFQGYFRLPNLGGGGTRRSKKTKSTKMEKTFVEMESMIEKLFSSIDMSKIKGDKLSHQRVDQINKMMDKCVPLVDTIKSFINAAFDADEAWSKTTKGLSKTTKDLSTTTKDLSTTTKDLSTTTKDLSKTTKDLSKTMESSQSLYNPIRAKRPVSKPLKIFSTVSIFIQRNLRRGLSNRLSTHSSTQRKRSPQIKTPSQSKIHRRSQSRSQSRSNIHSKRQNRLNPASNTNTPTRHNPLVLV